MMQVDQVSSKPADVIIHAAPLHQFVAAICRQAGSDEREAELVADHLLAASLAGHDSHGVGMIPAYMRSHLQGHLKINVHAQVVRDVGAVLTVDGGMGYGQVIAYEAMELGIARAKQLGVAVIGLRNSHHIGRIGHWAEQCAAAGLASCHFVNVGGHAYVAPFGGRDRRFGTNPFCAAFPRIGKAPLVLDFATSGIAQGKARVAYNKGVSVGTGNLIDHAGEPTIEPKVLFEEPIGALRTFGGHKGFGLAAMCEIFGGAIPGGFTTRAETKITSSAVVNGMLSVMIDPAAFDAPDAQSEAEAFVEWVKASPLTADADRIYLPGEPERQRKAERLAVGLPIDGETWRQMHEAALSVGMTQAQIEQALAK